nr:hypothetical protein [Tanacetum cinerariifolium]
MSNSKGSVNKGVMRENSKKLKGKFETMKGNEGDERIMFEFILKGFVKSKVWDKVKEPLSPKLNEDEYSICCENTTHMMNALKEARMESREMLLSIHQSLKMLLDIISAIEDTQKVRLASMHMFDKALNWHKQFVKKNGDNVEWVVYEREVIKSRQTPVLPVPRTPSVANSAYRNASYPPKTTNNTLALPAPNTKPTYVQPRKQLSQREIADKRAKNLCFYCDEKFVPGHKCSVHALIDSGSTHTFLDIQVAKRMGCRLRSTCPMDVSVANGQIIKSVFECKGFTWTLQGWMSGKRYFKKAKSSKEDKMLCIYPNTLFSMEHTFNEPQITELLDSYQDIFEVSSTLPPKRAQDHRIPLLPNTPPINIRPYKHPSNQKDAVEAMVKELMESGVIRDSQSPY